MYLEAGLVPARYQIQRQVLNYLKYILNQPEDSILNKMFQSMKKNPSKGDWASSATALIDKFELQLTLQEIKEAKPGVFKALVISKCLKLL